MFGKQNLFCNSKWFKLYPWLDYDEISDNVTSFVCKRHYSKLKGNVEKSFTSAGYSDWQHALSSFDEHQAASYHRLAMTYEGIVPQCDDIKEMQNESTASQMELNRRCLVKIVETLQFLARQGLVLRGDNRDDDSNFIQTLKVRAKDIPQLTDWMKRKQNKFMSHDIQNEIIQTMANQINRDITANIRNNFYSICDEYTYISNKEQLSFCILWVDKFLVAHEEFLGFYEVPHIKSETLVKIIKDILLRFQLS